MRDSVIKKITEYTKTNNNVFLVTGDAGFGVLDEYQKTFPGKYINMGVAEQNMIGFAAGLGLAGFKVFVYNIIPFLLYRCYEQVRNDICYQKLPITLIGIGSGFTYAPAGITHYAVEDIGIARTLPNLTVLSPADLAEAEKSAEFSFKNEGPVYIRIAKKVEPFMRDGKVTDITKPMIVKQGNDVAVLFHGSISSEVIKATEGLEKSPMLISVPMIQPLNFDVLLGNLKKVHTLITVEEHFVESGLGSIISNWITKECLPFKLKKLGIRNEFIHKIKDASGMRSFYGISADNISNTIIETFENE